MAGQASEISIAVYSSSVLDAELIVTDGNGDTIVPIRLNEHQPYRRWQAVYPLGDRSVTVELRAEGRSLADGEVSFRPRSAPLIVHSRATDPPLAGSALPPTLDAVTWPPSKLPHTPAAAGAIAAIVTDARALARLDNDQYRALSHYLGRCGILLLASEEPATAQGLREIAGCGGRSVQGYGHESELAQRLARSLVSQPPPLPNGSDLSLLQRSDFRRGMLLSLALMLGGYVGFMALASRIVRRCDRLLAIPVIVTAVSLLAWTGEGSTQLISWAETRSGDVSFRASSLLLLGGDRRGTSAARSAEQDPPPPITGAAGAGRARYRHAPPGLEIQAATRLLLPRGFYLTGADRYEAPYSLRVDRQGPRVRRHATPAAGAARLLWRGKTYPLPALDGGATWRPREAAGRAPANAAESLLDRRLRYDEPAILLPMRDYRPLGSGSRPAGIGWLVIRAAPRSMP